MLKIGICDDSPNFINDMNKYIKLWNKGIGSTTTESFMNGEDLIEAHKRETFDIIILDIVMPLINGIDVAKSIREFDKNVKIIFLTSSKDFAVDSYSVKAYNYLLKPIDKVKLFDCLNELVNDLEGENRYLTIKSPHSYTKILINNIEYVEAQNKHTLFCMSDGRIITSIEPLHIFQSILNENLGFFMCHRSYIVNLFKVDKYSSKEIKMHSGCLIPISRNSGKQFKETYFSVIFEKKPPLKEGEL